ncbi:DEAD/DEAH box helicase [Marinilactibacillus kalidii]|uniref:DEAD/DEAH box helicase n=1 Tax=Marinilactibacillus kalidii TaxID=2820274 RepID=UPI001ABEBFD1|nr:DEAD/DEAH box helicase [Marinilactibacillus kalidii]
MSEELIGREVMFSECKNVKADELKKDDIYKSTGFYQEKGVERCRRCNTAIVEIEHNECTCGQPCTYCTNCLQMGKVSRCTTFYHISEKNDFQKSIRPHLKWEGTLSDQQKQASEDILRSIKNNEHCLLWAVAGAGKTEMLFPGIEHALKEKKRVGIASPRVDVCLELAPRIQQAFPSISVSVLYGASEEAYRYTQIVVATTHQLYRFKEAFDLLVIDEIDAFPFRLDKSLHFAVEKARKKGSSLIFLTATPDRADQKKIQQGKINACILPARYHGYPLPVPRMVRERNWKKSLLKRVEVTKVYGEMKKRLEQKRRFMVFLPNINWMTRFSQVLANRFPTKRFESVHSQDDQRKEKVQMMREKKLDFILTTTILERGVTFEAIDVFVVGADDRTFTESALVQIAGRVGRSPKYPTGDVFYFHDGSTKPIKRAIKQIKTMNKMANQRGLLKND